MHTDEEIEPADQASYRVLMFDRECALIRDLYEALQHDGYTLRLTFNSPDLLSSARNWAPDLIVIGLGAIYPALNSICRCLQEISEVPLMILSGQPQQSRVIAADEGATDYVPLPSSLGEIRARVRAQLHRATRYTAGKPRAA